MRPLSALTKYNPSLIRGYRTLLFSILCSLFGASHWVNIWLFIHYLFSPIEGLAGPDQRMLQMNYAATLLPTIVITSLFLPKVHDSTWFAALPVVVNLFHRLLASFVKDNTPYNRFYNTKADLPWIRLAVGCTFFITAGLFQYQRFNASSGLLDEVLQNMSITNSFHWMVSNTTSVGAIFWEQLLYKDLKEAGMAQIGWVPLIGIFCLSLSLVGPGATVMAGWMWREEILATRRHKGAVNTMD